MSELRTDPLTGRSVYIAADRANRPSDFKRARPRVDEVEDAAQPDCPFCAGNEHMLPGSTHELRDAKGAWKVLAVPNKYPTVDAAAGQGIHEVIIETPRHISRTSQLTVEELTNVLAAYAHRLNAFKQDGRFPYRLLFKNVGPAAGASLSHLHSQVIALPEIPPLVANELQRLESHNGCTGELPWKTWLDDQLADGSQIVAENAGVVACCPPVSRLPYETWILPACHEPSFEDAAANPEKRAAIAELLHRVVDFVENHLQSDYNLMIQTAPTSPGADRWFHWRIEIVPRVGALAGFELPTGLQINTVPPERAAETLRNHFAPVGDRA